jgi:hypothetical protein
LIRITNALIIIPIIPAPAGNCICFATQVPPLFFKDADVPLLVASVVLIIFVIPLKPLLPVKVLSLANILMVSCVIAVSYNLFVKCVSNTVISANVIILLLKVFEPVYYHLLIYYPFLLLCRINI